MVDKNQLVTLLAEKGIGLKPIDPAPAYNLWNRLLQEEQIRSTPSCVIIHGEEKKAYKGSLEVTKALEILRDNFGKTPAASHMAFCSSPMVVSGSRAMTRRFTVAPRG